MITSVTRLISLVAVGRWVIISGIIAWRSFKTTDDDEIHHNEESVYYCPQCVMLMDAEHAQFHRYDHIIAPMK